MADIRDVALDTAVDNEATCGASVSLCSACVMSATSPSSKMMLIKKVAEEQPLGGAERGNWERG